MNSEKYEVFKPVSEIKAERGIQERDISSPSAYDRSPLGRFIGLITHMREALSRISETEPTINGSMFNKNDDWNDPLSDF